MQRNVQARNPKELLIELRRRVDQTDGKVQLADSLAYLLTLLNAPPKLPGLLRIAENILAILEQGSGVPIPENMNSWVAGWKRALTWITSNGDEIATEVFKFTTGEERFRRTTGTNPVLTKGAISSPIYCQLWEVHPRTEYEERFRILKGHLMFAQFDIREKIDSSTCPYTSEERRVANNRLYRTTYPLQQIASMQTIGFAGEIVRKLFASIRADLTRGNFAEELWRYRGKFTADNSELRDCLSALVRQLDWSLNSSYHPEPRPESQDGNQNSGVSDPTPFSPDSKSSDNKPSAGFDSIQPTRVLDEPARRSASTVSSRLEEFDELDDMVFRGGDEDDSSRRTSTNIFRHTKESSKDEVAQQILATGDHPGNYLPSDSTDLAENARGVLLDRGGWQEMRNQYLPWSLSELADEELADAWQRLERHAQTLEPDSVELFALINVLLWTGRLPKNVMRMEVRSGSGEPTGEFCFQLSPEVSLQSSAEWRIRPLPVPLTQALTGPVHRDGARRCLPIFALPDYVGTEKFIRQTISLRTQIAGSAVHILFDKDLAYYKNLLKRSLAVSPTGGQTNTLSRVTLERISYSFFQRIVDLTAGDLVAASLITGKDLTIARDDRFYATPSIESLRSTYRKAVQSIRSDLIALNCSLPDTQVVVSGTEESSVGSTICPTVERIRVAVSKIKSQVTSPPIESHSRRRFDAWVNQHNSYTLYTVMMVGWVVGFRAICDPYIYPDEVDFPSGLMAFQDKGPQDRAKSRLTRLPRFALAQIEAYSKYQSECAVFLPDELKRQLCFIETTDNSLFFRFVTPSAIEKAIAEHLPLPANASRHFGRTEWIERNYCPQYASVWLAHFFRGEEPWGKYSTFSFADYCRFMNKEIPKILKEDLGFEAIDHDGRPIADYHPDLECFRRRGKAGTRTPGNS